MSETLAAEVAEEAAPAPEAPAEAPAPEAAPAPEVLAPEPAPTPEPEGYWQDDWRERMAKHASAGNEKEYEKELNRLQRFASPEAIYNSNRELENRLHTSGLVKFPDENSSDEEVQTFLNALGVPETPEGYIEQLQLSNGAEVGEQDMPLIEDFAQAYHQAGGPPHAFNALVDRYYQQQEAIAAQQDEADDQFRVTAQQELREEFGPSFNRLKSGITSLFASAEGGVSQDNPDSLFNRLFTGRMGDGSIIGDDPAVFKFFAELARDRGLGITEVDAGQETGKSIQAELAEILQYRRDNKSAYFKDEEKQARYRELVDAEQRLRERNG